MSQWVHIQRSFAGGEISGRMLMRQDHEFYKQSCLGMVNFMPGTTGSALRCPGTRYLMDTGADSGKGRIIPFLSTGNERSLLLFTNAAVKLIRNINEWVEEGSIFPPDPGTGTIIFRQQKVENGDFNGGLEPWVVDPIEYTGANGDGPLGVFYLPGNMVMIPRLYKWPSREAALVTAETTCEVDVATDSVTIDFAALYDSNPPTNDRGFRFNLVVSKNTDYSTPIWEQEYTHEDYPVAGAYIEPGPVNASVGAAWTGTLYIKIEVEATTRTSGGDVLDEWSNPRFHIDYFHVYANAEATVEEADLVSPYTNSELKDIQYVQSPYGDKELVVVHPSHEPYKFYFDTGTAQWKFEAISFTNAPSVWGVNNYPSACTSFRGRLVLAGGQSFKITTGSLTSATETVWMTEVGQWDTFTVSPTNPDDSVEFTSIFRSPIQWVHGMRNCMIGALEYEYSADGGQGGIIGPGNIDVVLRGTNGSNNIQPVAFGDAILFPANGGTKLRSMQYSDEGQSWVAQDLTIYHPEICTPRIRRIVRCRNPRQMCMVLTDRGELSIFHSENGIEGWSRYRPNEGHIHDICITVDNSGRDIPLLLVYRYISGVKKLYLEAIPNFAFEEKWAYVDSHLTYQFETPTDTITGLGHLEGKRVQVQGDVRYLGSYEVSGGQIVLTDDIGGTTNVTQCTVGRMFRCQLNTLPPEKLDPGAQARYTDFYVRCAGSTRPIINGERPPDRDPQRILGRSQSPDIIRDTDVAVRGFTPYNTIEISEQIPFRCEILGIYGTLEANRV